MPQIKVDLHVHTCYSPDATGSLDEIIVHCQKTGIDCIAVTDHNTIAGALAMQEVAPFPVVVGEEIMTSGGEVIGYLLTEPVPPGLSPEETMKRIRDQGGLVCLPHPFDTFIRSPLRRRDREELRAQIDIVEVFNARSLLGCFSKRALSFARKGRFLASAGSDAHTAKEVGRAYLDMRGFKERDEFRMALSEAKVVGQRTNPWVHMLTTMDRMGSRFRKVA